jgi:hypothetical protein
MAVTRDEGLSCLQAESLKEITRFLTRSIHTSTKPLTRNKMIDATWIRENAIGDDQIARELAGEPVFGRELRTARSDRHRNLSMCGQRRLVDDAAEWSPAPLDDREGHG